MIQEGGPLTWTTRLKLSSSPAVLKTLKIGMWTHVSQLFFTFEAFKYILNEKHFNEKFLHLNESEHLLILSLGHFFFHAYWDNLRE